MSSGNRQADQSANPPPMQNPTIPSWPLQYGRSCRWRTPALILVRNTSSVTFSRSGRPSSMPRAVLPSKRSTASATKPRSATCCATNLMLSFSPVISWMMITPGWGSDRSGRASKPIVAGSSWIISPAIRLLLAVTVRSGLRLRYELRILGTSLRYTRSVRSLAADFAVADELQEDLVHEVRLIGLGLVAAFVQIKELEVRQRLLLKVGVLRDREGVLVTEDVDYRDGELVEPSLQVHLLLVLRVAGVLARELLGCFQRLLLGVRRHRAHGQQVL